jgi:hypothetical protein
VPLDLLDRRIEDVDPAPEVVVLVGLQVARADADQRARHDRQLRLARRAQHDLPGPRQEALGQLEAGVLFADDEDALAGVLRRGHRLGVVGHVLDPRRGRLPRLGHADGEHEVLGPVLAVRRLEDEAVLLGTGRRPAHPVTDVRRRLLGEGGEVALHLGTGGELRDPIHDPRHEGSVLRLDGEQAVPVVALVVPSPALVGGIGPGPREQPLEDREAAEHAARSGVGRELGVRDAKPAERIADLQAAGPAPDDEERVVPGRERLAVAVGG